MKKRFMFTLTKETTEELYSLFKEAGLPSASVSKEVDNFIKTTLITLQKARAQGKFTVSDMFRIVAEQLELQEDGNAEKREEKKKARK